MGWRAPAILRGQRIKGRTDIAGFWDQCRYDCSQAGTVKATVVDSDASRAQPMGAEHNPADGTAEQGAERTS